MRGLDKGLAISLKGLEAEKMLAAARQQLKAWGVAMPNVAPLVLDFGLGDFEHTGSIEFWIANEPAAGYCGKYMFVFDGQTCPTHHHKTKHETFFIVKGSVRITQGDREIELGEGDVLAIEPGQGHSFTGRGPALLLELSMPCEIDDNYFEDKHIPIGGNYECSDQ